MGVSELSKRRVYVVFALSLLPAGLPLAEPVVVYGQVKSFANLPEGVRNPEGLAVNDANGEVYVGTFDARSPDTLRNNQLLRYSAEGKLLAQRSFGPTPLTGIEFKDDYVYILNFGGSKLQRITANFTSSSPVEDLLPFTSLTPPAPAPRHVNNLDGSQDVIIFGSNGMPAPNGMVFDQDDNLYISDSFQGAIYRVEKATSCEPCTLSIIARDPLFTTTSVLPFGANGLAFNTAETVLYINNAGDGRVLRMQMPNGPVSILAESVFGADGLLFNDGYLWVASNQSDAMVALDEKGRVRARIGQFLGIGIDGAPKGLLFPSGGAVQGNRMIVANLAFPLTANTGDEWEEEVTRWNLVSFEIPQLDAAETLKKPP